SGSCTVGSYTLTSTCSFVMLGNIEIVHGKPRYPELLRAGQMPEPYRDTAFLDRIHGILPGWDLAKMKDDAKGQGLGLQAGVLTQWLQSLRGLDVSAEVDSMLAVPKGANLRDVRSAKRLMGATMTLLYPHWEIPVEEDEKYLLRPALDL